ncbi:zonular occludens toxin domain-containing protein [Faucicola boevrei]|uniref:zonular occludens toxin domain-containing protein n=1 Tax=Faucicola boevrei TaxID=346665 RepID=UPI000378882F|nr:zonular occludens toxin domain-containing protein [Moraxella boevrei]
MLHLVTGTPGTGKTAFVVTTLDKVEKQNKVNLAKNKQFFLENKKIIDNNQLQNDFTYLEYETGSGHTLKKHLQPLDNDYFSMFTQDFEELRPDDYFKRANEYNAILERISERESIKGFVALSPVRTIYTNINNLKIDFVRDNIYDWRDCPDGSIIVIDEVQLVEPYDNLKDRNNKVVQDLTIHRHRGFDFYFLTQAPVLLHPTIKVLIGIHYHLTKPYGWKTKVYQWGSTRDYPNTMVNKINCERKFDFTPPKYIFKLYKSTTINTHQKRVPYKMIVALVVFLIICFYIIFKQIGMAKKSSLVGGQHEKAKTTELAHASVPMPTASAVSDTQTKIDQLNAQLQELQLKNQIEQLKQQDKIAKMPVNVVLFGDKCTAYNVDGLVLDLSFDECKQYATGQKSLYQKPHQPTIQTMPTA